MVYSLRGINGSISGVYADAVASVSIEITKNGVYHFDGTPDALTGVALRDADGKLLAMDMASIGAMNLSAGNYTVVVEGVGDAFGVFTLSFGPGPSAHQSDSDHHTVQSSDATAESDSLLALSAGVEAWKVVLFAVLMCFFGGSLGCLFCARRGSRDGRERAQTESLAVAIGPDDVEMQSKEDDNASEQKLDDNDAQDAVISAKLDDIAEHVQIPIGNIVLPEVSDVDPELPEMNENVTEQTEWAAQAEEKVNGDAFEVQPMNDTRDVDYYEVPELETNVNVTEPPAAYEPEQDIVQTEWTANADDNYVEPETDWCVQCGQEAQGRRDSNWGFFCYECWANF